MKEHDMTYKTKPEALWLAAQLENTDGARLHLLPYAAAELRRLHAEVESLRTDAERYRWLRDKGDSITVCAYTNDEEWIPLHPENIDATIDAAMKAERDAMLAERDQLAAENEALRAEVERLSRYYKNGIDCFANPCERHSGERTPPFAEFFEKYGGQCLICVVDNNKALQAENDRLRKVL